MKTSRIQTLLRRRPLARAVTLLGVAVAMVASGMTTSPATAAVDEVCATPLIRETMVSQGLPTYASLARGKSTLVKYFLSMPSGCDPNRQYLTITGGAVTVLPTGGTAGVTLPLPTESFGPISAYTAAPSTASTGNPTFLVKGSELGPTGAGGPYSVTFTGSITYTVTDATGATRVTSAPRTLNIAAVSRTVDVAANPMRILVVPIGDERRTFDTNFPVTARNYLASAMSTLGRLLPVADGVGRLSDPAAGIRYDLALSDSLVDIGPHDHDFNSSTPEVNWLDGTGGTTSKYCPSSGHFSYISTKLATAREKWNAVNPNAPASRVLGVLWQDISRGASTDDETGTPDGSCVEGYADVAGTIAWSRIIDPHPGNVASSSGSIAGMELMHTLGAVPSSATSYHSLNSEADKTAPDRAYDVPRRSHIANDKSVMSYFYDTWHDDLTLLEPTDWTQASCVLSSNAAEGLSRTACSEPATAGATAASLADRVHLAGKTDGTPAGTHAATYVASTKALDATDPNSPYQLVYKNGSQELGRMGVRVVFAESHHEGTSGTPGNTTDHSHVGIFDVAVAPPAGTTEFAFVKAGSPDVVLYGRGSQQRPTVTSVAAATSGTPVRYVETPPADPRFPAAKETALSEDGSLIAWEDGSGVRIRRTDDTTSAPLFVPDIRDPSFAHTRNSLVYTTPDGGDVAIVDLNTASQVPTLAGTPRVVYESPRDTFGSVLAEVEDPVFSPTDDRIVLASVEQQSQLYILSATATCRDLSSQACSRQVTTNGYASDPSWGRSPNPAAQDGIIAFLDRTMYDGGSSAAIAVTDAATGGPVLGVTSIPVSIRNGVPPSDRTVIQNFAAMPDWGGNRLTWYEFDPSTAFQGAVHSAEGTTFQDRRLVASSRGEPSLSGDDNLIAYSVEEPSAPQVSTVAIYLKNLTPADGERVVEATDDRGRDLRLDVVAVCPGATYPLVTDVAPTTSSNGGASFQVEVETAQLCANATLRYEVNDGFQIAPPVTETVQGTGGSAAAVAVTTPRDGDTFLQHRSVPLAVNGRDADGAPASTTWTITGPGGTNRSGTLGAGERTDLAPFTTPGTYTLTATAGGLSTTASFTVLEDQDADGIPASQDSRAVNPCLPANADNDPRTAVADYDGDFVMGADDPSPCSTVHKATVDFDPNSLNVMGAGNSVTLAVTSQAVDLSKFTKGQIAITRLAGHYVQLPATSWSPAGPGVAVAKFDRQALQNAIVKFGLKGFIPVLVQGTNSTAAFSGIDPDAPHVK